MTYLIMQMWAHLLVAFFVGMFLGYLLCKMLSRSRGVPHYNYSPDVDDLGEFDDIPDMPAGLTPVVAAKPSYTDFPPESFEHIVELDTDVDLDSKSYGIQTLEGIGPRTGDLFRSIGVATVGDYLRKLHSPGLRVKAAEELSIKIEPLHEWASMSDLLRIAGVDHQFSELMHASGIQTVSDLAHSTGELLVAKMEAVNNAGPQLISPQVPDIGQVNEWIARAKTMAPAVSV